MGKSSNYSYKWLWTFQLQLDVGFFWGEEGIMVLNATFKNISVISWRSVLLVEEIRLRQKTTDLPQVTDKLCHIMLYRAHLVWAGFELTTLVVIDTNCIGTCSYNFNIRSRLRRLPFFGDVTLRMYRQQST